MEQECRTYSCPLLYGHEGDLIEEEVLKHCQRSLSVDGPAALEDIAISLKVIARRTGTKFKAADVPHDSDL
jgi:hypothetical protein